MTAPGPHKTPTTRRAARQQRDGTAARPEAPDSPGLPEGVTDAGTAPVRRSNHAATPPRTRVPDDELFAELDLGNLVPAEPSLPRVHRSTFTTERTRPGSRPASPTVGPEAFTPFERRVAQPSVSGETGLPCVIGEAPQPPATSEPPQPPATSEPAQPPATVEPAQPPATVERVESAGPATGPTRRAQRAADLLEAPTRPVRHARAHRAARVRTVFGLAAAAALILGGTTSVTAALTGSSLSDAAGHRVTLETTDAAAEGLVSIAAPLPARAESIPVPTVSAVPASVDACVDPAFTTALAAGDDAGAIALAGGASLFHAAIAEGRLPCVPLDDPSHVWIVVNKLRAYDPIDYRPSGLTTPEGVRDLSGGALRADASAALSAMVRAAAEAGVGEIALLSAFRSYDTQRSSYGSQVDARGTESAELVSARPGHSEHQSGLAADVVACAGGCGGLDGLAGTPQGDWIVAHAWEHGWIVRYEDGHTGVTGYAPEPWHLRYIGPELAAAYHDGGWHTLEEFFGLPAAPDYRD